MKKLQNFQQFNESIFSTVNKDLVFSRLFVIHFYNWIKANHPMYHVEADENFKKELLQKDKLTIIAKAYKQKNFLRFKLGQILGEIGRLSDRFNEFPCFAVSVVPPSIVPDLKPLLFMRCVNDPKSLSIALDAEIYAQGYKVMSSSDAPVACRTFRFSYPATMGKSTHGIFNISRHESSVNNLFYNIKIYGSGPLISYYDANLPFGFKEEIFNKYFSILKDYFINEVMYAIITYIIALSLNIDTIKTPVDDILDDITTSPDSTGPFVIGHFNIPLQHTSAKPITSKEIKWDLLLKLFTFINFLHENNPQFLQLVDDKLSGKTIKEALTKSYRISIPDYLSTESRLSEFYNLNYKQMLSTLQFDPSQLTLIRQKAPYIYSIIHSAREQKDKWKTDLSADLGDLGF